VWSPFEFGAVRKFSLLVVGSILLMLLTTTVSMNGLSSSCVLAATTVPMVTSASVWHIAFGGRTRLDRLPVDTICTLALAMSMPGVAIGVGTALLCAAFALKVHRKIELVQPVQVGAINYRGGRGDPVVY